MLFVRYRLWNIGSITILDCDDDWIKVRIDSAKGTKEKLIKMESVLSISERHPSEERDKPWLGKLCRQLLFYQRSSHEKQFSPLASGRRRTVSFPCVPGKRRGLAGHLIMQLLYSDYTHIRQLVSDRRQRLVLQNVTFQKEAYKIWSVICLLTKPLIHNSRPREFPLSMRFFGFRFVRLTSILDRHFKKEISASLAVTGLAEFFVCIKQCISAVDSCWVKRIHTTKWILCSINIPSSPLPYSHRHRPHAFKGGKNECI